MSPRDVASEGEFYRSMNHERFVNKMHVVTYDWVISSADQQQRLSEKFFYV